MNGLHRAHLGAAIEVRATAGGVKVNGLHRAHLGAAIEARA